MPPDTSRISELRRRVHSDPASIAFAQLAEEYRRAGSYDEAVKYCRTGLARHPGYLSARVTLGRALIELGGLDEAAGEFMVVLASAPDNLTAIRGMAEIEQRRGNLAAALDYFKRALALARFDPEIEEAVTRIGREMGSGPTSASGEGLSFEQASSEFLSAAASGAVASAPVATPTPAGPSAPVAPVAPRTPVAPTAPLAPHIPKAPVAPADPVAPAAPSAPMPPSAPSLDFDALLASLGAPDAAPPAVMEMLLSKAPASELAQALMPTFPMPATAIEAFADLERELQAFDAMTAVPAVDPVAMAVLDVLEAWVRVLESERVARVA